MVMQAGAIQYVLHDEFMPGTDLNLGGARAVALRLVHELHETNLGGVVTEEQILAKFSANIDALKEAGRNAEAPEWVRFLLRFSKEGGNWYRPSGSESSTENRGHQRRLPMSTEEKMFVIGRDYSRRDDIHARFGGQTQGGISTPRNAPYAVLFTGKAGGQYGYEDGWRDEDIFVYTGEGQLGDMTFKAGNRAIRDHANDGKELLLFESLGKGQPVRFLGSFACPTWEYGRGPDRDGNERTTIRFHLVRTGLEVGEPGAEDMPSAPETGLEELRRRAYAALGATKSGSTKEARRVLYERSQDVRDYVLARAGGVCELTGQQAPFRRKNGEPYLEVHHTRRLSDDGPDDPRWVAAITPTAHREIHYGQDGIELNRQLQAKLKRIEDG